MRDILRRTLFAVGAGLILTRAASAADANPDGAASIRAGLERYLGQKGLTVTPLGAAYRIDIDVKAMLQSLERFGVTLDPAVYSLTVAPEEGGLWHVTSSGMPAVTAHYGGQTTSIVSNGQSFDGDFDARIPAFAQWTGRYDSMSIGVTGAGTATQARQMTDGRQTFKAAPSGDGVIDGTLTQANASFSQDVTIDDPKTHLDIALKSGPTKGSTTLEGLRARAIADVWAYLVAHPSVDAIKAGQADLRVLLRQMLPLFGRVAQDGTLDAVTVRTPVGTFGADHLASHIDLHGLTADGLVGIGLKLDGLRGPTDKLPRWTAALIPTLIELRAAFSGFHLDDAARTLIDAVDLTAAEPLPKATQEKLPTMLGPRDKMVVTIGESRLSSPTIDLRFSGDVRLTEPLPTVAVTVRATGLDAAIAAAQKAAKQDPTAAQAIPLLIVAKGYGKAEPDGGMSWAVAVNAAGAATINGLALPTGSGK